MIFNLRNNENLKTSEIIGKNLKGVIKRRIEEGDYKSQIDFFNRVQERLEATGNESKVTVNNPNTYNKYLTGENNMKLDTFKMICIESNSTADYLLGLSPVNRDFLGGVYKFISDMGYKIGVDPENEDNIRIYYNNQYLKFDYHEIKEEIKLLFEYLLFVKSKENE